MKTVTQYSIRRDGKEFVYQLNANRSADILVRDVDPATARCGPATRLAHVEGQPTLALAQWMALAGVVRR